MQSRNVCPVFDTGTDVITGRKQKFRRCVQKSTSPLDCLPARIALQWPMPTLTRRRSPVASEGKQLLTRDQKITLGEMRSSGVRGLLIYCADYHCSHSIAISADRWPDDVRLSDLEARFAGKACGKRGADVRPNFNWNARGPVGGMG